MCQQYFLYVSYFSFCVCVAVKSADNCASGAAMAARVYRPLTQENYSLTLPGEIGITLRNNRVHNYRPGKLHAKLHVSIVQVSRDPAHPRAALLLILHGLQEICIHQCLTVQHRLLTHQIHPPRTYKMPPMNGPVDECGCCVNCEDCVCDNGEECNCTCPHEIGESSTSSPPPPPPPLMPPPTVSSSSRARPPQRNMSPTRQRTRSRSRSPTPRCGSRERSRDRSREGSVAEAARYVAHRVWRRARRDRRELGEMWEDQSRRVIAQFKIGHKEGITCAQRLHNHYVLPTNLSLTFFTGFIACLAGVIMGLIMLMILCNAWPY